MNKKHIDLFEKLSRIEQSHPELKAHKTLHPRLFNPLEEFVHKNHIYDPFSWLRDWWKFSVNPWGLIRSEKTERNIPMDRFVYLSLAKEKRDNDYSK